MKFGEKVRAARQNAGMSQEALAKAVDVSLRTILGYENENRYPRKREIYAKLADALHVDVNYLLTEDEEFAAAAAEKYGSCGKQQAEALVAELSGLFAGGELADEDMDAMMRAVQDAYWIAKENNRKFVPKKYQKGK